MKTYPKKLDGFGLTPVFVPRQEGYLEHYALLSKDGSESVVCGDLDSLVEVAEDRIKNI